MSEAAANKPVDNKELRKFGLLFAAILLLLFEALLPWLKDKPLPLWPLYISAPMILLAVLWPAGLRPLYNAWMKFGLVAGAINTRIIMGVVFFLLMTPMAWLMRRFGHDPLARRLEPQASSYRVPSEIQNKEQMEKPY